MAHGCEALRVAPLHVSLFIFEARIHPGLPGLLLVEACSPTMIGY